MALFNALPFRIRVLTKGKLKTHYHRRVWTKGDEHGETPLGSFADGADVNAVHRAVWTRLANSWFDFRQLCLHVHFLRQKAEAVLASVPCDLVSLQCFRACVGRSAKTLYSVRTYVKKKNDTRSYISIEAPMKVPYESNTEREREFGQRETHHTVPSVSRCHHL